jgi:hypothetical protein
MKVPSIFILITGSLSVGLPTLPATAHAGGLDSSGCHHNRKTGDYHCHRASGSGSQGAQARALSSGRTGPFRNCSEARAAGAAPVYRGQPGYAPHLDRDNDGIGCE